MTRYLMDTDTPTLYQWARGGQLPRARAFSSGGVTRSGEPMAATSDLSTALDFGKRLFDRLCGELLDINHVRAVVERLKPLARTFPEVRFCKGCVMPAVSDVAYQLLSERYGATSREVYHALRCEGFQNLAEFYTITETRPGFSGSPWNRDKQPFSKSGGRAGSGANPDFCIWYSQRGFLRVAGEVKYKPEVRRSTAAVSMVLDELRYYLAIKSCSHSEWGHDFGFGVAYCAGGDQPRKAELVMDHWESDKIMLANFTAA